MADRANMRDITARSSSAPDILPDHRAHASSTRSSPNPRSHVLLLVAICAITFFAGLGTTALWEPDEPRFAEATRQMLERGDYLTPWFNDRPRFEKPVLLYWLQLPFFAALGATETAARLPSAIAALLAVLASYAIARELVSPRAGLLAAITLATTFRFVLYARQGLTDVPVAAAVTLALWAMTRALNGKGGSAWTSTAWLFAGIGILLKGPVGLLAPIIWSVWGYLDGGIAGLRRTRPLSGLAIAAAVSAPWFAAMVVMHGRAFVDVALGYEVVARYLSPDFPGRDRGFFYYWGVWLGDGAPWSLFVIPAIWWALRARRTLPAGERRLLQLAGIWFATVLLVFSVSQYKLPHYILPAYPAMALIVGLFANAAIEGRVRPVLWRVPALASAVALAACGALLWLLLDRAFELPPLDGSYVLPVLFGTGAVLVAWLASPLAGSRPLPTFAALAITLALAYGTLCLYVAPHELRRFQPVPDLAAAIRRHVSNTEPLAVAGNYGAPGLVFYARRRVRQLTGREELISYLSAPGRRHCVLPEADLQAISPQIHRRLVVQAQGGVFSVRMRRLLERDPGRAARVLVLVTAE